MNSVYVVDILRTAVGKFGGTLASVRPDDLAAHVIKGIMERNSQVNWSDVDEVIFGAANQAGEDNRNVARMASLLAGIPETVPGYTVNRLCASGLQSLQNAYMAIKSGGSGYDIGWWNRKYDPSSFCYGKSRNCVLTHA